ncbi:MAG: tetratricopeptide repeat protein [Blastocatellia bacterium]
MKKSHIRFTVRPQQPWHWLLVPAILLAGTVMARHIYPNGPAIFGAVLAVMLTGFVLDVLVYDGEKVKRRGPAAWLYGFLAGYPCELTTDQIETISSYAEPGKRGGVVYRTIISGYGLRWEILSRSRGYEAFIDQVFRAAGSNKLDPRSRQLLAYWRKSGPALQMRKNNGREPVSLTPAMWREAANHLALDGQFDMAARYFCLALRREPRNAELLYEMGRFLQLRAMLEAEPAEIRRRRPRGMSPQESCARRSQACFRLAGMRAGGNAALLERIGESFFEVHDDQRAATYFSRALGLNEKRLRASIGQAEVAFRDGRLAHTIHYYNAAARVVENDADQSLAQLAQRRAEYYELLRRDDKFLDDEIARLNLRDHLRMAQRGALFISLAFWFCHVAFYDLAGSFQALTREIGATAAVIWLSTTAATLLFTGRRP